MFKTKKSTPVHSADQADITGQVPLFNVNNDLLNMENVNSHMDDHDDEQSFEVLRSRSQSPGSDSNMDEQVEHLQETLGADPLNRAFGQILRELTRLKVRGRERSRPVNIEPICHMLREHLEATQQQTEKQDELRRRLANLELRSESMTGSRHLNKVYQNPLFCTQVDPPNIFGNLGQRKLSVDEQTKMAKLFPRGSQRFSGDRFGPPVVEFLARVNDAQRSAELTEPEFKVQLLNSCTGEAYTELKTMVEANMTVERIYFTLEKMYDNSDSPLQAIEKLGRFRATKDMSSKCIESHIVKLAAIASRCYPKGPTRTLQTDLLSIKTYLDCLPTKVADFVRIRCNDLTVELGRAPQFNELSTDLDPHRFLLDSQIAEYGKASFKRPGQHPKAQDWYRAYQGPSYQLNAAYRSSHKRDDRSSSNPRTQSRQTGQWRAPQANWTDRPGRGRGGATRGRGAVRMVQSIDPSMIRGAKCYAVEAVPSRQGRGFFRGRGSYNNDRPRQFRDNQNPRPSKRCSLCGQNSHTAAEGCFQMRDEDGNVVKDVTPTWGACTKSDYCQREGLQHPERYCPVVRKRREREKRENYGDRGNQDRRGGRNRHDKRDRSEKRERQA